MNAYQENTILNNLQQYFKNRPDISVAILFGSAAKNRLTPNSDVDIAVASKHRLSFEEKTSLIYEIARLILYEVDIVDLHTVSGPILQQALCTGIILKKSTEVFSFLIKKMLYHNADMMPYTQMILRKNCMDFING